MEIPEFLISNFPDDINFILLDESTDYIAIHGIIENINDGEVILFLGHGSSNCLYGSPHPSNEKSEFLSKDKLSILNNKNFFCLSCNSYEFIKRNKKFTTIINAVGFGDLPTDWVEIVNAREFDNNAYPGITADIVAEFSSILVELHKLTFRDYFHRNLLAS
ncbi:hypothetical protein [Spirosoma pollinicola]|uniref:hypothetical protein n=1 Tax=Spirosoma pollinicola TaxID=2057025 RepID=UPI0012FD3C79|nr:hypothetical protein [Spirosoma pollinicola]